MCQKALNACNLPSALFSPTAQLSNRLAAKFSFLQWPNSNWKSPIASTRAFIIEIAHSFCINSNFLGLALRNNSNKKICEWWWVKKMWKILRGRYLLLVVISACGGMRAVSGVPVVQLWQPTFPCRLIASWEKVHCSLPYGYGALLPKLEHVVPIAVRPTARHWPDNEFTICQTKSRL